MTTTSHSAEITEMRKAATTDDMELSPIPYALVINAVASLLETHDATGISLEQAPDWAALVNAVLADFAFDPFTPNGA